MLTIHIGPVPQPTAEVVIFEVLPYKKTSPSAIGNALLEKCPRMAKQCLAEARKFPEEHIGSLFDQKISDCELPAVKSAISVLIDPANIAEDTFEFCTDAIVDKCAPGELLHKKKVMLITTGLRQYSTDVAVSKANRLFMALQGADATFDVWIEQ